MRSLLLYLAIRSPRITPAIRARIVRRMLRA